ncbi:MAG: lipoyl(octanoyl) transferase LipB [Planctomycetes bacterium]|nr:lipoyl(octanoyl) transferase LipB [Planctomycetota bacterium]
MEPVIQDLGRIGYDEALAVQRALHERVVAARDGGPAEPMHLLVLEHDPVVTVSRRPGAAANLLATPAMLERAGVSVRETDRGGDITYHGPGQLVAYAIFDLNRLGIGIHGHMRLLEEIVLGTLKTFGIEGCRDSTATGVWVGPEPLRKICALGVRASRYVTMHGLALNVSPDLSHFRLIVPCGLVGRPVTSMAAELGDSCPRFDAVRDELARQAQRQVNDLLDRARVAKGAD